MDVLSEEVYSKVVTVKHFHTPILRCDVLWYHVVCLPV